MTWSSVFILLCQAHHSLGNSHMEDKIGRWPTIDLEPKTEQNHTRKHNQNKEPTGNTKGHIIAKGRTSSLFFQN